MRKEGGAKLGGGKISSKFIEPVNIRSFLLFLRALGCTLPAFSSSFRSPAPHTSGGEKKKKKTQKRSRNFAKNSKLDFFLRLSQEAPVFHCLLLPPSPGLYFLGQLFRQRFVQPSDKHELMSACLTFLPLSESLSASHY